MYQRSKPAGVRSQCGRTNYSQTCHMNCFTITWRDTLTITPRYIIESEPCWLPGDSGLLSKKNINVFAYFVYRIEIHKMHWSILLYMIYLWRTRSTGVSTQVKSCVNCKFFLPPTDDFNNNHNVRLGKCLIYPYPETTVSDLVVGMSEPNYAGKFRFAVAARTSETLCGHNAVHFSPKTRKFPPAQ
jgi:hypothetical protein